MIFFSDKYRFLLRFTDIPGISTRWHEHLRLFFFGQALCYLAPAALGIVELLSGSDVPLRTLLIVAAVVQLLPLITLLSLNACKSQSPGQVRSRRQSLADGLLDDDDKDDDESTALVQSHSCSRPPIAWRSSIFPLCYQAGFVGLVSVTVVQHVALSTAGISRQAMKASLIAILLGEPTGRALSAIFAARRGKHNYNLGGLAVAALLGAYILVSSSTLLDDQPPILIVSCGKGAT